MALTPEQQSAIESAYAAGDYGATSNLLSNAGITASQADAIWGPGISNAASNLGVSFAPSGNASTAATETVQAAPSPIQSAVDQWFTANPNATTQQIANAVTSAGGLTPELANILANRLGTDVGTIQTGYTDLAAKQAAQDRANSYAGKLETSNPAAYSAISNVINRAVNKDYGGKSADWMYEMFGGLNPSITSGISKSLQMTPATTETRTGYDENNNPYTYQANIPAELKPGQTGIEPVYSYGDENTPGGITGYRQKIDSDGFKNLYANYDTNGNLTGYSSDNRIYVSDPQWYGAQWDPTGKAIPVSGYTSGGGFFSPGNIGGDILNVASVIPSPIQPYAAAANAALAADRGDWTGAVLSGLNAYSGYQGNLAGDMTTPGSSTAVTGTDLGNATNTAYTTATQNAANAKLAAAAVSAGVAADKGNYVPLLALGANVVSNPATASLLDMKAHPEVATAFNSVAAVQAVKNNDLTGMLNSAGALTGSSDLKLAGAANNFVNAYNSGNSGAIASAAMALGTAAGANMTATNAIDKLKSAFGGVDTTGKVVLPTGSPINPSGPDTKTSDAGPLSGINLAGADNRYEMGGPPIFAGTAKAATVTEPVGYRLMRMDEADARPTGSYYDITQNAWFTPDEGGMDDIRALQGALSGQTQEGYGTDVTHLDNSTNLGNLPDGESSTTTGPLSGDMGTIEVVGNRDNATDLGTIDIVGKKDDTSVDDGTDNGGTDNSGTKIDTSKKTDDGSKKVVDDFSNKVATPITPTKTTTTTTSPLAAAAAPTIPKLDSSPQGLTSTVQRDKKILKELHQLFGTLTPELVSALEDRGIRVPRIEEFKEPSIEEELANEKPETPQQLAEDKTLETKFVASGGTISNIDPKITYEKPGMFAAAPVLEQMSRLGTLKHLREGIGARPMGGLAKGGLPHKYAEATPDGHKPEFITGLTGYYASGEGTGQSDDIDAILHDGDYVADADLVAALGDGSSKAGAEALEKFRRQVPHHEYAEGGQPVPAKIADGEYVFPASFVTALGKGDNKAGAALLDKMREAIREHKRSAPVNKIPPKAKSPLDYLKMVKG